MEGYSRCLVELGYSNYMAPGLAQKTTSNLCNGKYWSFSSGLLGGLDPGLLSKMDQVLPGWFYQGMGGLG